MCFYQLALAESVALQFGRCTKAQQPKCFKASINQWLRIPSLQQQIAPVLMLGFDEEERRGTMKRSTDVVQTAVTAAQSRRVVQQILSHDVFRIS